MTAFGGHHHATASLTNVLAAQGMTNPHTGEPFSEAMILGIGGGLGAGYILWEFKREQYAIIVQGFRNRWNHTVEYLSNTCDRLGVQYTVQETSGKNTAARNLEQALETGTPFLMWIDKAYLPYQHLPESLQGHVTYHVGVHGYNIAQETLLVDDLADDLFAVSMASIVPGRARISSDKNRIMLAQPEKEINLEAAIKAGITDCVAHLGRDSESFALPVYQKWAKLMTNTKNKKGWHVVFQERKGLYSTLRSVYEGIRLDSTEGAALRSLYADFLSEASSVLGNASLNDACEAYRAAVTKWIALSEIVLPDQFAVFQQTKELMQERYRLLKSNQIEQLQSVSDQLQDLQAELDPSFPMSDAEIDDLFVVMQDCLLDLYQAEVDALNILKSAI